MNINYTSHILYTFVFIVRLISIPNVYFPNLIFIPLLNSYFCSCTQDLRMRTHYAWFVTVQNSHILFI